jgi:hypothetical protein
MTFSSVSLLSVSYFLMRTFIIEFRAHSNNPGFYLLKILSYLLLRTEAGGSQIQGQPGQDLNLKKNSKTPSQKKSYCILFFIIVVLGVHCDIYKSSYNVSSKNHDYNHMGRSFSPVGHTPFPQAFNGSLALTLNFSDGTQHSPVRLLTSSAAIFSPSPYPHTPIS